MVRVVRNYLRFLQLVDWTPPWFLVGLAQGPGFDIIIIIIIIVIIVVVIVIVVCVCVCDFY